MSSADASVDNRRFEIDHVFVMTEPGAGAAAQLIASGFSEGPANVHPGQGTRNRRFFFEHGMLELLWVHDGQEARTGRGCKLALWQRWSQRRSPASPFGICLRRTSMRSEPPFRGWAYQPLYLPREFHILVADRSSDINQPLYFYLPFVDPGAGERGRECLSHRAGVRRISGVRVVGPRIDPGCTSLARSASDAGIVFERERAHCLHLEFDGARQGRELDLRPQLALVLRW